MAYFYPIIRNYTKYVYRVVVDTHFRHSCYHKCSLLKETPGTSSVHSSENLYSRLPFFLKYVEASLAHITSHSMLIIRIAHECENAYYQRYMHSMVM